MSKHHYEPLEQNDNTYQTGFTPQPKRSSGLIAVLLVLTIFLGGLASMLGLLNIRLLEQLMQQQNEAAIPVDISTIPSVPVASSGSSSIENDASPVPQVPSQRQARLYLRAKPSQYGAPAAEDAFRNVYDRSMVRIHCSTQHSTTQGVGMVISSDGYILTNAHGLETASWIYVELSSGQIYRAALVGMDMLTDLAVLYISAPDLVPVEFGYSDALVEEDTIGAVGVLPVGDLTHVSQGAVTVSEHTLSLGKYDVGMIQTDLGSCCGPVFNLYGQVVAMNSSLVPEYFDLYVQPDAGFAVPSTLMKTVVDQLLEQGYVSGRPSFGITTEPISKVYQQFMDLPGGLRINSVSAQAQAQGLREGDVLLAINGQRLTENADLYQILFSTPIGQSVTAVVLRGETSIALGLTILDTAA